MKIVSCFVNCPFICQWQKEQTSDSPAPLHSMCKELGKSELLSNLKWNGLIYWSCHSLGKWQCKSALLWMLALLSEQSHQCCYWEKTPTQPIQTKGSIFFPVTCSSVGALRKPHSSLAYFWTQNPFSWAGREMKCQKHYPSRKHIHTCAAMSVLHLIIFLTSSLVRSPSVLEEASLVR